MPKNNYGYVCNICDHVCATQFGLKRHMPLHDNMRKFQCELCSQRFTTNANLEQHIRGVHDKVKPFTCHVCKHSFASRSNLQTHSDSRHSGKIKRFSCGHCKKRFWKRSALLDHTRSRHSQGGPQFKCEICVPVAIFKTVSALAKHHQSETHRRQLSQKPPFKCGVCRRSDFPTRAARNRHVRTCYIDDSD